MLQKWIKIKHGKFSVCTSAYFFSNVREKNIERLEKNLKQVVFEVYSDL